MTMRFKALTNSAVILLALLAIYAAGHSEAMRMRLDHPACHPNLKP